MFRGRVRSIHFVGIGGVGMSGLAEVLLSHGYAVSGSDQRESETTTRLRQLGARVVVGHQQSNLSDADVVVFSSAVRSDNPEIVAARERGIPVIPRAEMLAELMRLKDGIAIAGAHGKTTTTSLIATLLQHAKLDPTVVIGGKLNALGSGAQKGTGNFLVAEADESDGSFVHLNPVIAVVTNIDEEHIDFYGSYDRVKEAFVEFCNHVPFYGAVITCLDDPTVQEVFPRIDKRVKTYGFSRQAEFRAADVVASGMHTRFRVSTKQGEDWGEFAIPLPGQHNVLNALAAIALGDELGLDRSVIRDALAAFAGVQRRFTVVGEVDGVTFVDDYAHHPSEIEATLAAANQVFAGRRLHVVFQPHRFSRLAHLFERFTGAFHRADFLYVMNVYAAGEQPIPGFDSAQLVAAIRSHGHRSVTHVADEQALGSELTQRLEAGDAVLLLGAGDIIKLSPVLMRQRQARGAR